MSDVIGKRLLVGIYFKDDSGNSVDRVQVVGRIRETDGTLTLTMRREDGRGAFTVPLEYVHPANPGPYRLTLADPEVRGVDFFAVMTVTLAPGETAAPIKRRGIEGAVRLSAHGPN